MKLTTVAILQLFALSYHVSIAASKIVHADPHQNEKGRMEAGRLLMEGMDKRSKDDPDSPSQSPSTHTPNASKGKGLISSRAPGSSKGKFKSSSSPGSSKGKGMSSNAPHNSKGMTSSNDYGTEKKKSNKGSGGMEMIGSKGKGKGKGKGSKSSKSPSVTKSSKTPTILMKKSKSGGKGMMMELTLPPVTASPTSSQAPTASRKPSASPSSSPTVTVHPSEKPSSHPSSSPSQEPSKTPTQRPTTATPTTSPFTASPTDQPFTAAPSESPTANFKPTQVPSSGPTETQKPSAKPSPIASSSPTISQKPTVSQAPTGQTALPTLAPDLSWNFFQGFDCDSDQNFWESLNSAGAPDTGFPELIEIDPGDPNTRCFLRMTPDTVFGNALATSAFLGIPVNDPPNFAFRMSIGYRIFGTLNNPVSDGDGADGMVFVMHRDERQAQAIGGTGGNIGVYSFNPAVAIKPALTVEWDTFRNPQFLDETADHVHIMQVNDAGTFSEIVETPTDIRTSETDVSPVGSMFVDYNCDGNGNLEVRLNNQGTTKPVDPLVTEKVSIQDIFFPDGGNGFVYVGYTAAIGGFADNHDVFGWEFVTGC